MADVRPYTQPPAQVGRPELRALQGAGEGKLKVEQLSFFYGKFKALSDVTFEIPYEDTAKGKVKDWLVNYKKMFNADANTQAIIGYNAVMTFAFYANKAGKDLTGQKMLDALESGDKFLDIFNSPPTKFSKTDHLANTITQVQQVKAGRWVLVKDNLVF